MKTRNTKLDFRTQNVMELNEAKMIEIDGGTTPACIAAVVVANASSAGCVSVAAAAIAWLMD